MGLLLSRLSESARAVRQQDALTTALHTALLDFKAKTADGAEPQAVLGQLIWQRQEKLRQAKEAGSLEKETRDLGMWEVNTLEDYRQQLAKEDVTDPAEAMETVRGWFGGEVEKRKTLGADTGAMFDNTFRVLEQTVGQDQELVLFVTEVTAGYDTSWFVENFGCDAYFRHNKELLFDDTRHRIRESIAAAKAAELEERSHE